MSKLKAYTAPNMEGRGLTDYYLKSEADKVIAEKDTEIRRLKRALWLARAKSAENAVTNWCPECMKKWNEVERKCLKKAAGEDGR